MSKQAMQPRSEKAQSAMEYLMTYGWAILIIAVVLGALFQLGVFNPMTFAPKAPPGACQVFRPNGPGTTAFINTEGVCSGEMPQYVAQFNGQSSYINFPVSWPSGKNITAVAWINLNLIPSNNAGIVSAVSSKNYGTLSTFPNGNCYIQVGVTNSSGSWFATDTSNCIAPNNWYQIVAWANQSSKTYGLYINGKLQFTSSFSGILEPATSFNIGLFSYQGAYFPGKISNVQIYNISLSPSEVQALYQEGIGGAPIDLQHLVGWWPLNGNANDYSGNGNNGVPNGVNFVSNWWNGYTPP